MIFVKGMKPWQYYANEMHTRWNFLVAWPPNQKLSIGDVGTLEGNVFTPQTSLDNLGIEYNKNILTGNVENEEFYSEGQVKVYNKFEATAQPSALSKLGADVVISFQKENAVYYKAPKSQIYSLDDKLSLGNKMVELYQNYTDDTVNKRPIRKEWELNWAVITDLHYAERATIIISNKKDAYVGLNAAAGTDKIDILNLNCDLQMVSFQGIETKIIGEESLTPLFNVLRLDETVTPQLGAKQYWSEPPGEAEYKEYVRNLPTRSYKAKPVEYESFAEAPDQ